MKLSDSTWSEETLSGQNKIKIFKLSNISSQTDVLIHSPLHTDEGSVFVIVPELQTKLIQPGPQHPVMFLLTTNNVNQNDNNYCQHNVLLNKQMQNLPDFSSFSQQHAPTAGPQQHIWTVNPVTALLHQQSSPAHENGVCVHICTGRWINTHSRQSVISERATSALSCTGRANGRAGKHLRLSQSKYHQCSHHILSLRTDQ